MVFRLKINIFIGY